MNCDVDFLQLIDAKLAQGKTATAIVSFTNLENRDFYKLRYCIRWSDATGAEVLQIQVGLTGAPTTLLFPVLTRDGDPLLIGRLRRRELLCLRFVNPNTASTVIVAPHFVVLNCLAPQCIRTPDITPDAPPQISPEPTINPVLPAATTVTGTGQPGATVAVTFPGGTTVMAIPNSAGVWTVNTPAGVTLATGNVVTATQTVSGMLPSTPVSVTV